jgi:hypothetical protein
MITDEMRDRATQAKLDAQLNKRWSFDCGVMTMRDYLTQKPPVSKHVCVREYSSQRIHLEYVKLAEPKLEYSVDYPDGTALGVPKVIWDWVNVPEGERTIAG